MHTHTALARTGLLFLAGYYLASRFTPGMVDMFVYGSAIGFIGCHIYYAWRINQRARRDAAAIIALLRLRDQEEDH